MKVRFVGVVLVAAVASCGGSQSSPQEVVDTVKPEVPEPTEQTKKSLASIEAIFAAWNERDLEAWRTSFAEGATLAGMSDEAQPIAIDLAAERMQVIWKAFPQARVSSVVSLANGSRTAVLNHVDTGAGQSFVVASVNAHDSAGRITSGRELAPAAPLIHQFGIRKFEGLSDGAPKWPEKYRAESTGSEQETKNVELIKRFFEAVAAGDTATVEQALAEDHEFLRPATNDPVKGRGLFLEWVKWRHENLDVKSAIKDTLVAGDWVVAEIEEAVTPKGKPAQPAITLVLFFHVRDDKIAKTVGVFDLLPAMHGAGQLSDDDMKSLNDALRDEFIKRAEANK